MFQLNPNTTLEFQKITGYDVNVYLTAFSEFKKTCYQKVLEYYQGKTTEAHTAAFDVLKKLKAESDKISQLTHQFKDRFKTVSDWYLVELLDEVRVTLWTIEKTPKFSRSSHAGGHYAKSAETVHVMRDRETLEDIQLGLGSKDRNSWYQIALRNDLSEDQWEINEGGRKLIVSKPDDTPRAQINSVVDILQGERLYGKDLNREISFVPQPDGSHDLDVLGYKETFLQSVGVLAELKKGDIPEFPSMGITPQVGTNLAAFTYRSTIREMEETFRTDDTMVAFSVTEFSYKQGSLFIAYQVNSFYNFSKSDNVQI